jgi:N-acetyl-1-D-myo-inositol-2-amino-2-deoxy-alpha-D-glucopyranoside deacetylase
LAAEPGGHVAVVVAHPDDESFGCGSLIASAAAAGATVTVICATRGERGERVPDPDTDAIPLGELRERELRAAAAVLGARAIELLDHADSGFDGPLSDDALCSVDVEELARDIGARLGLLEADLVVILDGSDGHRDHLHIRAAVELAVQRSRRPLRVMQSCLPKSLMQRWIEEARALRPDTAYLDIIEQIGRPDSELTAIDVSAYLGVREAAIACHRSQHSPYDGLSPDLRRAFLSTDFVVVTPADPPA